MLKKSWWIIIIILVTTIAYLSADLLATYLQSSLESISDRTINLSKLKPISKEINLSKADYAIIEKRDIFGIQKEELEPEPEPEPKKEEPKKPVTKLRLKLLGTIVGSNIEPVAFIKDLSKRKQDIYREQDDVGPAKLLHIYRNKVILLYNGREEMLLAFEESELLDNVKSETPEKVEESKEDKKANKSLSSKIGKKIGPSHWVLNKSEVENVFNNASQLLTEIRIIPHFKEGKLDNPDGFQMAHVKRGSLFDRMGVKSGDVIRSVNNHMINSPEKAFEAYQMFKSSDSMEIVIERNKKEMTLKYDINE